LICPYLSSVVNDGVIVFALCRWVFVPWEFVKFNVLAGGSAQYGSHPWHWNLTAGLPTVAATLLPLALAGILITRRHALCQLVLA